MPDIEVPDPNPTGTSDPTNPPTDECTGNVQPGRATARLLTRVQYNNTLRDLIGDGTNPADEFPAENVVLGFSNNADAHQSSLILVEKQVTVAEKAAERLLAKGVDQLLPCAAGDRSLVCVDAFLTEFGSRAFRRPIRDEEKQPLLDLFTQANGSWGFDKALQLTVEAILQSPQLLYRMESEVGPTVQGEVVALDGYQLASRLSYFLWDTMPDDELLDLAASGDLQAPETIHTQALRMLEDPRARDTVRDFNAQWLGLSRFDEIVRQADGSALAGDAFNASWQASLESFVQYAFWEGGGNVSALLTSPAVFVDTSLNEFYGFGADVPQGEMVSVTDPNRAGLLTQPALMALLAHSNQSAPVQRGLFVREQVLCHELPPPPPDVDTTPPDPSPNATTRERFREHSSNERCAVCHSLLEGVGFGFESFDQLGRFRTEENGIPVDASGNVTGTTDMNIQGPFNGAVELSQRLSESPQVQDCLATQWFRYGMGRAEDRTDTCSLDQVKAAFSSSGGDFKALLVALTATDVFRYRAAHDQDL